MKNLKIISAAVLAVSCLTEITYPILGTHRRQAFAMSHENKKAQENAYESAYQNGYQDGYQDGQNDITSDVSLSPNYGDDANVSIQSTTNSSSNDSDSFLDRLKAKMNSSTKNINESQKDKLQALKAKMQSASEGKDQSSEFKDKLKSRILERFNNPSAEVKVQSLETQEVIDPTTLLEEPIAIEPTDETMNFSNEDLVLEDSKAPLQDVETTVQIPTNLVLQPISTPGINTEVISVPASEELSVAPETVTPELEAIATPTVSTEIVTVPTSEELAMAPAAHTELEAETVLATENPSDLTDQGLEENLLEPVIAPENTIKEEEEVVSLPSIVTSQPETAIAVEVNDQQPSNELDDSSISTPLTESILTPVVEEETNDTQDHDQLDTTIIPALPVEPTEVPVLVEPVRDSSALVTGIIDGEKVVIVKVYPVFEALRTAAQSVKAAALEMIDYIFKRDKTKASVDTTKAEANNAE